MEEIDVRTLMSENEMLSHIFFECLTREQVVELKNKYVGTGESAVDWRKTLVTIPFELKIGGIEVNPKAFFDNWVDQMERIVSEEATKLLAQKMGSEKIRELKEKLDNIENVFSSWEEEVNWDVKNPFK